MQRRLIISVHRGDIRKSEFEALVESVFGHAPREIALPIPPAIREALYSQSGPRSEYMLPFPSTDFPNAVFDLLSKMEDFGVHWMCRKPFKIGDEPFVFIGSLGAGYGGIPFEGIKYMGFQLWDVPIDAESL